MRGSKRRGSERIFYGGAERKIFNFIFYILTAVVIKKRVSI